MAETRQKSVAECRREYDALAREAAAAAMARPKAEAAVRHRVLAEMGDFDKKLAELKARKGKAHLELLTAEERERPEREKREAAEAARLAEAELRKTAKANADRKAAEQAALNKRLREAVAV